MGMRGIEISINTVVILIVALLALVVGMTIILRTWGRFSGAAGAQYSVSECQSLCASIQNQLVGEVFEDCTDVNATIKSLSVYQMFDSSCRGVYVCKVEVLLSNGTRVRCII